MSKVPSLVFPYSHSPHNRRHGPCGYRNYEYFKPWLRDEFHFRCVFCLCRERWTASGDAAFSVDHFLPQVSEPNLVCEYSNLVLACAACNSTKRDQNVPLNPCLEPMGTHLRVEHTGAVLAQTDLGQELIEICLLNREKLVEFRKRMIDVWTLLNSIAEPTQRQVLEAFFAFPENLPNLKRLVPPNGNTLPQGITDCYFLKRSRGELKPIY